MTVGSAAPFDAGRPAGDAMAAHDRCGPYRSVRRLVDRFELYVIEDPEALAIGGVDTLSRAELWLAAGIAAGEIRSAVGLDRRVVVVHLPEGTAWLVMFLAVLRAGHIPAILPTMATMEDLLHVFETVEPAMAISVTLDSETSPAQAVLEAAAQTTGVAVALAEGTSLNVHSQAEHSTRAACVPEDTAHLVYALSNAGPPQVVIHTEESVAERARHLVENSALSSQTPVFIPCPLGYGGGISQGACLSMFVGAPLILEDDRDVDVLELADHDT